MENRQRTWLRFSPITCSPITKAVTLGQDRIQDAQAITEGIQVADAVDSRMFVTRDLLDDQPSLGDTNVYQRLHFESVTPKARVIINLI